MKSIPVSLCSECEDNVGALRWLGIWNTNAQLPAKIKLENKRLVFIRPPNYCKALCYGQVWVVKRIFKQVKYRKMKQIRKGVFETNSSSTHSICIAKDAELTIPKSLHFDFGEFGWECDTLSSLGEKATYLYTGLIAENRKEDAEKIFELLKSKGIEVTAEEPILENKSYTNSEGKLIEYTSSENTGYVDHSDELKDFLNAVCEDESKLMNYLFSDLSFIITGNDNDDEDVDINVDYAHDEYYKGN